MEFLYLIVPLALIIAALTAWAFVWAAKSDQFEDLDTPPRRMLLDDEPVAHRSDDDPPTRAAAPGGEVDRPGR